MNRVWMITGAGRGLGRAFAEEAVKNGDMVIATVRKVNDADPLMKNENVLPVIMDVTKNFIYLPRQWIEHMFWPRLVEQNAANRGNRKKSYYGFTTTQQSNHNMLYK